MNSENWPSLRLLYRVLLAILFQLASLHIWVFVCVGLIWYSDTQWREVECVFKHNVVVISKNTGGIVLRWHSAAKHFGLNCSCIFHVAFPISATTREYVEPSVSTYTLFFIGLVSTSAQIGSVSKTLICLAVYCLLTTFQGSILTETVPRMSLIWESLHRQKNLCHTFSTYHPICVHGLTHNWLFAKPHPPSHGARRPHIMFSRS